MKELKLYQCEVCGTQYADKDKAKQCEQYHARGLEIDGWSYRGMNETTEKFPVKIWVKSKSGEERMYRP